MTPPTGSTGSAVTTDTSTSTIIDGPALTTSILGLLDPELIAADRFLGARGQMTLPRVFGGLVLGQALVSAGRTVPPESGKVAHSLHAYFLRAGDPDLPIEYQVERVRDGRRLSCRTVTASQNGRSIATVMASFAATTGGVTHQIEPPESTPAPQVPTLAESARRWGGLGPAWGGFESLEIRVDPQQVDRSITAGRVEATSSTDQVWQRVPCPLPEDQLIHRAFLAYASDVMILAAALVPHGVPVGCEEVGGRLLWDGVSVDHAIWFHTPVHADEWMLFVQQSPAAADGRAFTRAEVFAADGTLVASVAQEGLILSVEDGEPT
ncbi:acyl-CoA thioesterase-2 [Nakamurella sp. UYEF19]|uniref:acyl-CoA thioesterase n=1 Tax=Nakamurella sp. UYEF19 TaxID=1756392 RepID=UPI003393EF71